MANNIYRIDLLAAGSSTVTVTDDGSGTDWLIIQGSYAEPTDIRLNYFNSSPSTGASGQFFTSNPNTTHTLIVNGLIENVRGCDSADYIVGNELNNLLYGDQNNGLGGNDTLSGGEGNDGLYGGLGSDDLTGGAGNDRCLAATAATRCQGLPVPTRSRAAPGAIRCRAGTRLAIPSAMPHRPQPSRSRSRMVW